MRFLRILVGLAAVVLLCAVILGYGAPLHYGLDLLAHFRLHLLGLSAAVGLAALLICDAGALWRAAAAAALATAGLSPLWEGPGPAGDGAPLTVMVANVYHHNDRPEEMKDALLSAGADILVTVESLAPALLQADLEQEYPHRMLWLPRTDRRLSVNLWSKHPIRDAEAFTRGRRAVEWGLSAIVELAPGREVSVVGLHLAHVALIRNGVQREQVEQLAEMTADLPRPLIVMGDFNATPWSWALHRAEALTGARRIGGVIRTWQGVYPTPYVPLPEPFGLPIDHVLVSDGIGVAGIGAVEIPGSDHKAVRAELRIPEGGGSSAAAPADVSSGG